MTPDLITDKDKLKQAAAVAAAALLHDGMVVGLGSGTTATMLVSAIGDRVKQGLKITGIPTSEKTAAQARGLNIPLATFADYAQLDVTIDGADEVELGTLDLIKGGGGNQLREKIVASASAKFIVIVDASKMVKKLGAHALPVEVAQFGWESTAHKLTQLGIKPNLRHHPDGQVFITDGGNYILDCACGVIESAPDLERELNATVGVMEHGLFLRMASTVLIGEPEGVKTLTAEA